MNDQQKLEYIQKLSEDKLRKRILIPLFKDMGFMNVTEYHGPLEYGKDIIFCEDDSFGQRSYTGVQVKIGNINSANIFHVLNQAKQCLDNAFIDGTDGREKRVDKCRIITSGKIIPNAVYAIKGELEQNRLGKLVSFMDGNEIVTLIGRHMPSTFWGEYDYFTKYFNAMKKEFMRVSDVSALGRLEPVPLENIYVSLKLLEKVNVRELPEKEEDEEIKKQGSRRAEVMKERKREQTFDSEELMRRFSKVVIVGVPGSGKTTLVKHLALKSCMENLDRQERVSVPVPVILRELSDSDLTLRGYINSVFEKFKFPTAKKYIESDLKNGKCRILLDGFDELATGKRQDEVAGLIHEFVKKYPKNQIIVTSRVAGYHGELKGFTKLELMEFDDRQIGKFIHNWFRDSKKADPICDEINKNSRIKAIARNPLMIAIIAIIYEEDKKLPERRVELYERCVDVLLSKWDVQKRIKHNKYKPDVKKFILRKLALHYHLQEKRVLSEDDILKEMMKFLPDVGQKKEDAKPLLNELWTRNYLLRQQSMDSYDFLHLSFQEYFTALELEKENEYPVLTDNIDNPWWEEIILLFAGLKEDASMLIEAIQDNVAEDMFHSNLLIFGKCIADANKTKKVCRDKIIDDLWSLYKTSEYSTLRRSVIDVFALIKPDNIVELLIDDLSDKDTGVRMSAGDALGKIGSEKAVEALIKTLREEKDKYVRLSAADALGIIGSEKAVEALIKTLREEKDWNVRRITTDALGIIGSEKAVKTLIKTLREEKDTGVRWSAADTLGKIGSENAIETLIKTLRENKDSYVRRSVACALRNIGNEKAIETLIRTLREDEDTGVRWSAAETLGIIGSEKAIETLIKTLREDEDTGVRWSAADALGKIGSEKAIGTLIKTLREEKGSDAQNSVARALGNIGSEKAVETLIKTLREDEDSDVRRSAADALGDIRSEKAVETLIKTLREDEDSDVRRSATVALRNIGNEKAIDALIKTLREEKDSHVRWSAAETLGKIGSEKAIEILIKTLREDKYGDVRGSAAYALGNIGSEKAIETLIKALREDNYCDVRWSVAYVLGKIGSEKAIDALKNALKDDEVALFGKVKDNAFDSLWIISRKTKKRICIAHE